MSTAVRPSSVAIRSTNSATFKPCLAVSQAGREALGDEGGLWTVLHGVGHQSEAERPEYEPSDAVSSIAKYAKPQKPMTATPVM